MTKKNFITLILSTVGGILFALGMCMAMLPEWNVFRQGIAVGCIGLAVLLIMVLVRRKMGGRPILVRLSAKTIGTTILSIIGTAVLGIGMCMIMVWNILIPGIIVGIVGIILLLCLIPMIKGLK